MRKWLESFAYRTSISWWVFALTLFISCAIALATTGYQAYKAAAANPANTLRSE